MSAFTEFHEMGLDDRILKAIADLGWSRPTAIQERAIPLVLEGKDVLARARTGSGKTGAFIIPLLHKLLQSSKNSRQQVTRALVLTPTKELSAQAYKNIQELSSCCSRNIKCVDVSQPVPLINQRPMLSTKPDIVVGTPRRVLEHIVAGHLTVKDTLEQLVVDEADLVFSFGHEVDMRHLLGHLPNIYQACLMSATLSEDVKALKKLILHNPVILKLQESQLPDESQLAQYLIECEEKEKFVVMYALFKLELVKGRSLIFVNSVDRCYRLRLFLEQFGIKSCVLNSALPLTARCHTVTQFNQGLYDIIIASDESDLLEPQTPAPEQQDATPKKKSRRPQRKKKVDMEYGVSRGLDFEFVSNIINFDFPLKSDSYIHRVGRTARGDNQGTALSLVSISEHKMLDRVKRKLADSYPSGHDVLKKFQFKMEEIEGFRYRAQDALTRVTRRAVREARLKEIKRELFNSQKLQVHFKQNPRDIEVLRHDRKTKVIKSKPELKHVPMYLVPKSLKRKCETPEIGDEWDVSESKVKKTEGPRRYWSRGKNTSHASDALTRVTRRAVREARLKEIKRELFNSQKLQVHFKQNPRDIEVLRHDRKTKVIKSKPELKHVPMYLVPKSLKRKCETPEIGDEWDVSESKVKKTEGPRRYWSRGKNTSHASKPATDPLKTFKLSNRHKS